MKKIIKIPLIILSTLLILSIGTVIYLFGVYKPSLKADFSVETGEVSHGASGFLYGFAERMFRLLRLQKAFRLTPLLRKPTEVFNTP